MTGRQFTNHYAMRTDDHRWEVHICYLHHRPDVRSDRNLIKEGPGEQARPNYFQYDTTLPKLCSQRKGLPQAEMFVNPPI